MFNRLTSTSSSITIGIVAAMILFSAPVSSTAAGGGVLSGSFVEFGGGWGKYGLETLNDEFIGKVGPITDVFEKKTEGGPEFFAHAGYFVVPNLAVSGGFSYLRTGTDHKGSIEFLDINNNLVVSEIDSDMLITMFALEMKSRYYIPLGRISLFAGAAVAWCHGKVDMDVRIAGNEPDDEIYSSDGFGFSLLTGFSARIAGPFSLTLETGYRHYSTGTLSDRSGDEWNLDILEGAPGVDLDFNGYYGTLGFTFDM